MKRSAGLFALMLVLFGGSLSFAEGEAGQGSQQGRDGFITTGFDIVETGPAQPGINGIQGGSGYTINYDDPGNNEECSHLDNIHYLAWEHSTEQGGACELLEQCSWTTAGGSFVTSFISAARKLSIAAAGVSLACYGIYRQVCPPPILLGKTREYDLWEGYLDGDGVCRSRIIGSGVECVPVEDPHFCE